MSIKFASDDGKRPAKIKSYIVSYRLSIDHADSARDYKKIQDERRAAGVPIFDTIDTGKFKEFVKEDAPIWLETEHLFNNQWNSTDGRRVFEWHEDIFPNKDVKRGHYLTITPEMIAVREETFKCGYCGKNYHGLHNAGAFCPACLDSEYLKPDQIHLLRVMPCNWDGTRAELTPTEHAEIHPLYVKRQTTGNDSRAAKRIAEKRADATKDAEKAIRNATNERDGFLWMLDHNVKTDNVIYYSHTETFCIGWRTPTSPEVRKEFERLLKGFPFKVEYK
jgi:hypothetical protein